MSRFDRVAMDAGDVLLLPHPCKLRAENFPDSPTSPPPRPSNTSPAHDRCKGNRHGSTVHAHPSLPSNGEGLHTIAQSWASERAAAVACADCSVAVPPRCRPEPHASATIIVAPSGGACGCRLNCREPKFFSREGYWACHLCIAVSGGPF